MEGVTIIASSSDSSAGGGVVYVSTGLTSLVPTFDIADAMAVIVNSDISPHQLLNVANLLSNIALSVAFKHDPNEEQEVSDDDGLTDGEADAMTLGERYDDE